MPEAENITLVTRRHAAQSEVKGHYSILKPQERFSLQTPP